MKDGLYLKVRQNPKFQVLVKKRTRLSYTLSAIVLGAYYTFMLTVAFAPDLLRGPVAPGLTFSVGFAAAAALIAGSWLLTAVYSHFANGEFEELNNRIIEEIKS